MNCDALGYRSQISSKIQHLPKLPVPETARAWPHRCSSSVVVSNNALCVEMLGQEVELVLCGLERQLMELLL